MKYIPGLTLWTKNSHRYTNAFILSVTDEVITVISDWGNVMTFPSPDKLEALYDVVDDVPFLLRTAEERLQEQIEKLQSTLEYVKGLKLDQSAKDPTL